MEADILKDPHKGYVLELMMALGEARKEFVLVGAQSMRFSVSNPRRTSDFDFVHTFVT